MQLSSDEVRRLAKLARLAVSESEVQALRGEMVAIFALIEQMQSVDTSNIEPMSHAQDLTQRLREDRVTETDAREALLAAAPARADGLFLVPKVIE